MTLFPGVAGQIEELIGQELTTQLLRRWGGCRIKLPKNARGSKLAEVIGADAAETVSKHCGHGDRDLPMGSMRGRGRRRADAIEMLRTGSSVQQVALACDLHTRTVWKYLDEIGGRDQQMTLPFDMGNANLAECPQPRDTRAALPLKVFRG
jgi:hypothetical protein